VTVVEHNPPTENELVTVSFFDDESNAPVSAELIVTPPDVAATFVAVGYVRQVAPGLPVFGFPVPGDVGLLEPQAAAAANAHTEMMRLKPTRAIVVSFLEWERRVG
jgi:hypothetical protein